MMTMVLLMRISLCQMPQHHLYIAILHMFSRVALKNITRVAITLYSIFHYGLAAPPLLSHLNRLLAVGYICSLMVTKLRYPPWQCFKIMASTPEQFRPLVRLKLTIYQRPVLVQMA